MLDRKLSDKGFTLIELVIVIVVLGILSAIAIPKLFFVTEEAEQASVDSMISTLESTLSMYIAKQYLNGQSIVVHNPFDNLSNIPTNYKGANDPVNPTNTPNGKWSWLPANNWIAYNPRSPINGGWENDGERFIVFEVQPVVDGIDTVGLKLDPTLEYSWSWQ